MKEIKSLLGQKIKELRVKKGLSQQKLSEIVNIDQRNLSNIECGNTFPAKSLLAIASALQVTLPELFDFDYLPKNKIEKKEFIINRLENMEEESIELLYKFVKLL